MPIYAFCFSGPSYVLSQSQGRNTDFVGHPLYIDPNVIGYPYYGEGGELEAVELESTCISDCSPSPGAARTTANSQTGAPLNGASEPRTPNPASRIQKCIVTRKPFEVDTVHQFMWEGISTVRKINRPGQPGKTIFERFGVLEKAQENLRSASEKRKEVIKEGKKRGTHITRKRLDKRRDFICFLPGCGLCFNRADKLERHLFKLGPKGEPAGSHKNLERTS